MKKLISIIMILSILNLSGCGTFYAGSLPKEERGSLNKYVILADTIGILMAGAGLVFLVVDFATGGAYDRELNYSINNKDVEQIYVDLKDNYAFTDLKKTDLIIAYNNAKNKLDNTNVCKEDGYRMFCLKLI